MIPVQSLRTQCNSRTFARAQAIAATERDILTRQVRYDEDEVILNAFVASSSGWNDRYRTSASYSEKTDSISDYACTCPAYREYDGMCKHCVALVLAYNNNPQKFMGYQAIREAKTSPCITDFLKQAEQLNSEDDMRDTIDLEPFLCYGYHNWSVHFKITGPTGSYVLKNLSEFVFHMQTSARYSYGKKLAFTHTPTAFTERGLLFARFLDRAISLREATANTAFLKYRGKDEVGRSLQLSEAEVVELLDLIDDKPFSIQGADNATRALTNARIVEEDPHVNVTLRESDNGGYLIVREEHTVVISHADKMYLWQDDIFYKCSHAFTQCSGFLKTVYNSEENKLYIAESDMPLFCASALPVIEKHLSVQAPAQIEAYKPLDCHLEFYFDKDKNGVSCETWSIYGDARHLLCGDTTYHTYELTSQKQGTSGPLRNERLESKAIELTERYFKVQLPLISLKEDEDIARLLFEGLAGFRSLGEVFTTPAFDRLVRDDTPQVTLGVSLVGNLINLNVSSEDLPHNELSSLLASYRKRKRFHRLRNGIFLDIHELNLSQLDRIASDLGISAKQLTSGTIELPAYRAFYLDEEADLERDRSFTRYIEQFRAVDERAYLPPESLNDTLRPYQVEGFRWLSARCDANFGGILADEMGLGKSLQLISLFLSQKEQARHVGPSLIVCPASLVYNWLAELDRFAPQLTVSAVVGSKRERSHIRTQAFASESCCDVLVTSYDLLRRDATPFATHTFFCCVLDEAQYIKNPATLTTRAAKRIDARHRFALTGTPMENRLSELWSIFDFLMPGLLGPYSQFRERFETPVVGGDEYAAKRLQALVGPFMLRRLKTKVLGDLPDKLESIVYTPLEGEQYRLYAAHEQQLRERLTVQRKNKAENGEKASVNKVEVLAELTKLRQLCCDPHLLYENYQGGSAKLDTIMEQIRSALDGGEKVLVFSQFTSFLSLIAQRLVSKTIAYYTITGATPKKERITLVNAFNEDDTPVFLISLKAGGTGLNLTGASVVIHADPWWNAAAQNQATDRAHRIGQQRVVNVQRIIAKNTIEERIVLLQEAKSDLADQVIGASGVSLATLTQDDLLDLLQG